RDGEGGDAAGRVAGGLPRSDQRVARGTLRGSRPRAAAARANGAYRRGWSARERALEGRPDARGALGGGGAGASHPGRAVRLVLDGVRVRARNERLAHAADQAADGGGRAAAVRGDHHGGGRQRRRRRQLSTAAARPRALHRRRSVYRVWARRVGRGLRTLAAATPRRGTLGTGDGLDAALGGRDSRGIRGRPDRRRARLDTGTRVVRRLDDAL